MKQGLYLGREVDVTSGALGARLDLDPDDLVTHGLVVGMTGSGKTGLAVALVEEVLRQGVPVLAIDPKGDLANLLLLFDRLEPEAFAPWIDAGAARRADRDVATAAAEAAALWRSGLAEWGITEADVAALRAAHQPLLLTPGSTTGVPLDVLQSLAAPPGRFEDAEEDLRDEIAGLVSGLLALVHVEADPLRSREFILLSTLVEHAWREGRGLTLEDLVPAIADPPFDKLGALPLETAYPERERRGLAMAMNGLVASPGFAVWRQGQALDIEALLHAPDGRPRLTIVSTAHLSDEERLFVTALVLDKMKTWMRRQPGTGHLRALVYMDEIFGYFPPHPANPATKRPMLTLLKQARAHGVGVLLATQNPVDLDYKGLANMGLWLVGRLQTEQDRARLRDGLTGAGMAPGEVDRLLGATKKRVFLLHDVHRPAPVLLHSRWAMSYLRGPLTRDEIERLAAPMKAALPQPPPASAETAAAPVAPGPVPENPRADPATAVSPPGRPVLPPDIHQWHVSHGADLADPFLLVKVAFRYKGGGERQSFRAYPLLRSRTAAEALQGEPVELDETRVAEGPPAIPCAPAPAWLLETNAKALERALKQALPDKLGATVYEDPGSGARSSPGESREAFVARLAAGGGSRAVAKLRDKLEKKRRDLAARQQDVSGRKTETWAAIGGAVLSNIGILAGRRPSISSAGSALSKNRMENAAEARVAALEAEVSALEAELAALTTADPARLLSTFELPVRTSVRILRAGVVWIA